jgi:hypothetical protein
VAASSNTSHVGRQRRAGSIRPARLEGTRLTTAIAVATVVVAACGVLATTWNEYAKHKSDETQKCLDPKFFDQLVDPNPKRRALALILLKSCDLDKEYVADIARAIAVHDDSPEVRANAASTLKTFVDDSESNLRQISRGGLADYALASELRAKGLLRVLKDAAAFDATRSPEGREQALTRYFYVLNKLSPSGTSTLDQVALADARISAKAGYVDRAVAMFSFVFRPYVPNQ